ncbi:hypothetical protein HXZ94_02105 [Empedobacter falsenii]|uniref:hypothetical protein n=1 Tax=Empedobacter falsenii TaxID=343874 RepID=UPI002578C375|nr:hypothetical protein [Empedobacter falsenii]MDM1297301.1 hypothetical protein [Empedobacter falsenii]MDM1317095.1 hypothetical protein [Empedobacter falsenii]
MKFNIKKYLYSFFAFVAFQQANAQVIFKEDFGQSSIRVESQYVPQGGADSSLGNFDHGSSFYKFAQIITTNPWDNNKNQWSNLISDGYYAVIDPRRIYDGLPAGKPSWATWWVSKQDHTGNANGAALVVNAGQVLNQFYRRAVTLEKGKTYKISAWIMSSGTQSYPKLIFEAQNIVTEASLGKSSELTISTGSVWKQLSWNFKIPNSNDCGNIAVALRNQSKVTGGNDFYLDDIVLEEVVDPTAPEIGCGNLANFDDLIKPVDDVYKWGTGNYIIHTNDKVSVSNTMVPIVLSGTSKNATISTIGSWPTGITLDLTSGEVKVAAGTIMPTAPLEYQVCSLIGVCSKATVTFIPLQENLALTGSVTNQCDYVGTVLTSKPNEYTLTITNKLSVPFIASADETLEVKFTISNGTGLNANNLDTPSLSISGNTYDVIWDYKTTTNALPIYSIHSFKLKVGQVIPANGSIQLKFIKNWTALGITQGLRKSLDISLDVVNKSQTNIDTDLSDNKLYISVFDEVNSNNVPDLTTKVSQYQVITVGEAAGLGSNTKGYTFFTKINGVETEIPSSYLIPTNDKGVSFSFSYKSECKVYKAAVAVPVGFDNPGTISINSSTAQSSAKGCYGSSFTVYGLTPAVVSPVNPIVYSWEVSKDNGVTWLAIASNDENYTNSATESLTIVNLTNNVKVRRVAKINSSTTADNVTSVSNEVEVLVTNNVISVQNNISDFSIPVNGKITIPSITTSEVSTIEIKDHNGVVRNFGDEVSFNTEGLYTITIKATTIASPNCVTTKTILVNVYNLGSCDEIRQKTMTNRSTWSTVPVLVIPGWVTSEANAVDTDLSTYSTITIPVGLLGLGTTWQNLFFDHVVPAGTPVTIKLGQEYSAVQVGGGVTVQALDANEKTAGPLLAAGDGALLDLLVGDNVFEYTFIPKDNNGNPIPYKGVRAVVGSTVAVANNAKIFGAYYDKNVSFSGQNPTCTNGIPNTKVAAGASKPGSSTSYPYPHTEVTLNPLVDDVTWGVEDIGLGVASSLASVVYPYLAVDNDINTFAIFNKSVAALNRQKLTVKFNQNVRPGDQIRILMGGFEVPVLDLSLLTDIKIQRYKGNVKVGQLLNGSQFKILDLNLLALLGNVGDRKALIVDAINEPFDKIEMSYLSTVQVGLLGDYTYVYDIGIMPTMKFEGQDSTNATALCASDFLKVTKVDNCTTYDVSMAYATKEKFIDADGVEKDRVVSFTDIPNSILKEIKDDGKFIYYEFNSLHTNYANDLYIKVQTKRQGCNYSEPMYLPIKLINCLNGIVNPVLKMSASK